MPTYRMPSQGGYREARKGEGENHPGGVMVHFYLKTLDEKDEVKLNFLDGNGKVIRSFNNKSKERNELLKIKVGGNRFVWDLRYSGFQSFPGMVFYGSPNNGPKAVPGKYKVQLVVNDQTLEQELEILKDPRINTTADEYQAQFDFLVKVRDKVSEANQGVIDIRKIKEDLGALKNKMGNETQYKDLLEMVKKFETELTQHENNLHQTKNKSVQDPLNYGIKINNRLAHLLSEQSAGDFPPTQQGEEVRQQLSKAIDEELVKLQQTIQQNTERINSLAKEKGVDVIMIKKNPVVN
jgi:Skp family chaperone for outer membrane proteins